MSPMATYKTKIDLPDVVRDFFETLTGPGHVEFRPGDHYVTFVIEASDEWELANSIRDLTGELRSANGWSGQPEIPRPTLVED